MRAGGLRHHTIEIQKPTPDKDEYGAVVYTWATHITTRADIDFKSGARRKDMYEMATSYTVDFRIRAYHQVNEEMRIIYKGDKYRIEAIMPSQDRQMQTLIGKKINE